MTFSLNQNYIRLYNFFMEFLCELYARRYSIQLRAGLRARTGIYADGKSRRNPDHVVGVALLSRAVRLGAGNHPDHVGRREGADGERRYR